MMTREERIAEALRALPAPPPGWVEAAKQLPAARRELETILERVELDERFRARVVADLEATLRAEGVEPTPVVVSHGGALTAVLAILLGVPAAETWQNAQFSHRNAAVTELRRAPNRETWQILRLADAAHLEGTRLL